MAFEGWVEPSSLRSTVTTLDQTASPQEQGQESRESPRRVVGVGNVGRQAGQVSYALHNPGNDQVSFKRVPSTTAKGFGVKRAR